MEKENNDFNNLIDVDFPVKHEAEKEKLFSYIRDNCFYKLKYYLDCGFNLLVYGVGSKRKILNLFASSKLENEPCLIINGFHSAASIKTILNCLNNYIYKHVEKETGTQKVQGSLHDQCEKVKRVFKSMKDNGEHKVYVLIHSMDTG